MNQLFRVYASERPYVKKLARPILSRFYFQRPFIKSKRRVLIIYFPSNVSASQIDPFFYYYSSLSSNLRIDLRVVSYEDFLRSSGTKLHGADTVVLQTWFELSEPETVRLFQLLHESHPDAKIVYFDWFAHLDLRLANILANKIDTYVKRQIFRDPSAYKAATFGVNNLEDYYGGLYGLKLAKTEHSMPDDFCQRLMLGPGFFTSRLLIKNFISEYSQNFVHTIDVHARMTSGRSDWYGLMRNHAVESIQSMKGLRILTEPNVSLASFIENSAPRNCALVHLGTVRYAGATTKR